VFSDWVRYRARQVGGRVAELEGATWRLREATVRMLITAWPTTCPLVCVCERDSMR
jgi:hypothetical protein